MQVRCSTRQLMSGHRFARSYAPFASAVILRQMSHLVTS